MKEGGGRNPCNLDWRAEEGDTYNFIQTGVLILIQKPIFRPIPCLRHFIFSFLFYATIIGKLAIITQQGFCNKKMVSLCEDLKKIYPPRIQKFFLYIYLQICLLCWLFIDEKNWMANLNVKLENPSSNFQIFN